MPTARRPPTPLSAFVLHQYSWSETSLIVDLFTREQGRLVVVAKGAKRPHSQLRSVLLPFQRILVSVGRTARSAPPDDATPEVQTLRSAEWAGGATLPSGAALFSGFYLNELLMKLMARHDPHPALFDVYAATLPALGGLENARTEARRDDLHAQSALRAFELRLLQQVGLLPDLAAVSATLAPVEPGRVYRLNGASGVIDGFGDTDLPGEALVAAQAALDHGSLPALQAACLLALPSWRQALRGVLHYHLGTPTLRTRQLMVDLQALER